jgi:serine/threonine protein kinase
VFSFNPVFIQPFHNKNQNDLFKVIRLGKYTFDATYWSGVSTEATSLIVHLLEVDPSTRYTATQALQSDWIKNVEESLLAKRSLAKSVSGIKGESSRLKTVAKTIQWLNRSKNSRPLKNISSLTVEYGGTEVDLEQLSKLNV